jgi:purine-binding chemotaxis protein CheW
MLEPAETRATGPDSLCVFERGGRRLAVPVSAAREVLNGEEATPVPRAPSHVAGAVNARGEPLSLVRIDEWVGVHPRAYAPSDQIVVIESDGVRIGLVVDRVHGIESPGETIATAPAVAGEPSVETRVCRVGDAEVAVLHAGELVRRSVALAEGVFRRLRGDEAAPAADGATGGRSS